MKLGIMQPYLFPWIGYFQLVNAVDELIIHDDVQYIKGGWINRNRMLLNDQPRFFTLPVSNQSHVLPICARQFAPTFERDKRRIISQLETAYAAAPNRQQTMALVRDCFACADDNVAAFVTHTLQTTCQALGIGTPLQRSSPQAWPEELRGQERVLEICRSTHATHYINAIGGTQLYDGQTFARNGLQLSFIRTRDIVYPQFAGEFVPHLSIIDVMMFNDRPRIVALLQEFDLESPAAG